LDQAFEPFDCDAPFAPAHGSGAEGELVMAMVILESCISCGKCESDCPNTAITPGDSVYVIDQDLCTECVGHADEPTCAQLCPVPDTIIVDPARIESREVLQSRFEQLHPSA
jgi:ferredoxin